ncbi:MAG: hypothetical protein SCALA702_01850 [Melioribacteraceae bacterium]|nr:MAG: hypothetical protein SCALA702_01850 [Melioribacteraceae bacterium]
MSKIEWTEKTWNPVTGCTKVSVGCKNCYAENVAKRFWGDRKFGDIQVHPERLSDPAKRKKPTMYFVNSMSDLFHADVSTEFIGMVLSIMEMTPQHTYQVLTKRPERILPILVEFGVPENLWIGVSVENQQTANERIPFLEELIVPVKWVSYEPALACVDFTGFEYIDWLVVGGESGAKKRPCKIDWFENARDWAEKNGIAFFMKQIDKVQEIPQDLMIREYPDPEIISI